MDMIKLVGMALEVKTVTFNCCDVVKQPNESLSKSTG